jgi:hypothetical protein
LSATVTLHVIADAQASHPETPQPAEPQMARWLVLDRRAHAFRIDASR